MMTHKHCKRSSSKGFTLVEVLMAIFVFSLLLSMAFIAVNALSKVRTALSDEESALVDMQKTINILMRDLSQAKAINTDAEDDADPNQSGIYEENEWQSLVEFTDLRQDKFLYVFAEGALLKQKVSVEEEKAEGAVSVAQNTLRLIGDLESAQLVPVEAVDSAGVTGTISSASSERWFEVTLQHKSLGSVQRLVSNAYAPTDLFANVESPTLEVPVPSGQQ